MIGSTNKESENKYQEENIMIIKTEMSLENFEAWSGAVDTLNRIKDEDKCEEVERFLEELYPEGMTDTELNDLLWYESETVYGWVGIRTYDDIKQEIEDLEYEIEDNESDRNFDIRNCCEEYIFGNITKEERRKKCEDTRRYYGPVIEELEEKIEILKENL